MTKNLSAGSLSDFSSYFDGPMSDFSMFPEQMDRQSKRYQHENRGAYRYIDYGGVAGRCQEFSDLPRVSHVPRSRLSPCEVERVWK